MAKRWLFAPITGTGTADDAYRAAQMDTIAHVAVIPSATDGTPKETWCLVKAATSDWSSLLTSTDLHVLPGDLTTTLAGLNSTVRTKLETVLTQRDVDTSKLTSASTVRDVVRAVGLRLDTGFDDARNDVFDRSDTSSAGLAARLPRVGGGADGVVVVSDSFTDTAGTNLEDHTGETGATWATDDGATAVAKISSAGRCYAAGSGSSYLASGVTTSGDQDVAATAIALGSAAVLGLMGRAATNAFTGYYAQLLSTGALRLQSATAGTMTTLASGTWGDAISRAAGLPILLELRDATKKIFVDGVEVLSSTDDAFETNTHAGIHLQQANTDTTGIHLDNFTLTDPNASDVTTTKPRRLGLLL